MIIKVIGLGEDSDQDMLAPDSLPPSTPDFLGKVGFNLLKPGYFLLQLANCMMETCMLLAWARSMSIGESH